MYHLASSWDVPADRREDFIAATLEDSRNSRSDETGTLRFELIEDEETPNRFYLNEAYVDAVAFRTHSERSHFRRFFERIGDFEPKHEELFRGTQIDDDQPMAPNSRFCGEGDLTAVADREIVGASPGLRATLVAFPPATRTRWHVHQRGQILSIVSGEGWLQVADGEPTRLSPGQVVLAEAGRRHWHGATANSRLEHMAISVGLTYWQEASSSPEIPIPDRSP